MQARWPAKPTPASQHTKRATAQRNERAYTARAQQLREKELTLAFDLEREDAGKRLRSHSSSTISTYPGAPSGAQSGTCGAGRTRTAGGGAVCGVPMHRFSSRTVGGLRSKARAQTRRWRRNYGRRQQRILPLRKRVLQAQSGASDDGANRYRLSAFGATYDRGADAAAIDSGLRKAGSDLVAALRGARNRRPSIATRYATQLMALEDDRHALYQVDRSANLTRGAARRGGAPSRNHGFRGAAAAEQRRSDARR